MKRYLILSMVVLPLAAEVKITYLANEGVLLQSGSVKVLVDSLFRDSLGDYARHDAATQEKLESAQPPFDNVTLVLATHFHLDHWDPGAISRHLRSNPNTVFASTPAATAMIPGTYRSRVRELWPDGQHGLQFTAQGLTVDAFPLIHAKVQNLAYRITMGNATLIHVGDAEANQANFKTLMSKSAPDVAMIPFWWLLNQEGADFVKNTWKPRHIVAFHFGADDATKASGPVRKAFPDAWLCIKQKESKMF